MIAASYSRTRNATPGGYGIYDMGSANKSIAIFGPYDRSETAYAACALTLTLRRLGYKITYLTYGAAAGDVHYALDRDVINTADKPLAYSGIGHRQILWFGIHPQRLQQLKALEPGQRHTLILSRSDYISHADQLPQFVNTVCPRRDLYDSVSRRAAKHGIELKLYHVPWEAERPVTTDGTETSPRAMLVIFGDSTTAAKTSLRNITHVHKLLVDLPDWKVTIWCETSWDSATYSRIRELKVLYPSRFFVVRNPDAIARTELFNSHGFCVLVGTSHDYGVTAADAMANHCPVISYDIHPLEDIVIDGACGRLVPCRTRRQISTGLLTAAANPVKLFEAATHYTSIAAKQRRADWPAIEQRRRRFQHFWGQLLAADGLEPSNDLLDN